MRKSILYDDKISLSAKGLYLYLISKSNNYKYQFIYQDVLSETKESKDKIRNYLKELIDNGYILKSQLKTDKGQFAGLIIEFTDKAIKASINQEKTEINQTITETNQQTVYEKSRSGKNRIRKTPTHNNIYNSNTDYINNKEYSASQFLSEPKIPLLKSVVEIFKYFVERYKQLSNKDYVLTDIDKNYNLVSNLLETHTIDVIISKINQLRLSNYSFQKLQCILG